MRVRTTEAISAYFNYQITELPAGAEVSGEFAEYLAATGAPVDVLDGPEPAASGPAGGSDQSPDEVPDGTAAVVLDWVGDDTDKARRALEAEQARGDKARSTLVAALTKLASGGE